MTHVRAGLLQVTVELEAKGVGSEAVRNTTTMLQDVLQRAVERLCERVWDLDLTACDASYLALARGARRSGS